MRRLVRLGRDHPARHMTWHSTVSDDRHLRPTTASTTATRNCEDKQQRSLLLRRRRRLLSCSWHVLRVAHVPEHVACPGVEGRHGHLARLLRLTVPDTATTHSERQDLVSSSSLLLLLLLVLPCLWTPYALPVAHHHPPSAAGRHPDDVAALHEQVRQRLPHRPHTQVSRPTQPADTAACIAST